MKFESVRETMKDQALLVNNRFQILQYISRNLASDNEDDLNEGLDILLRLAEHRELLGDQEPILDSLLRQAGLFPYLEQENLSFRDTLALAFHEVESIGIHFHRKQFDVYSTIMSGQNVALSAPTSFGKSLVIDAIVASKKFFNIVIIVPTLALIAETRRRFSRFRDTYKIITQPNQEFEDRNLLVLTQERLLEVAEIDLVDFFVIDEFYKLQPDGQDERALLLNQAFYRLLKTGAQFYLLGPDIEMFASQIIKKVDLRFIKTDYKTVATDTEFLKCKRLKDVPDALVELYPKLKGEQTLIYAKSPPAVSKIAQRLLDEYSSGSLNQPLLTDINQDAVDWLSENYHPDWIVAKALKFGIGLHHGKLPRSIAQFMVKAFNEKSIHTLICTSTLIEGVNTNAKNVVITDHKAGQEKYDYFTFNNIKGRSGRMLVHFVGRVFIFQSPPKKELPIIDIPIISQPDDLSDTLVVQIEKADRVPNTEKRFREIQRAGERVLLPMSIVKKNSGIEPSSQFAVAKHLQSLSNLELKRHFSWKWPSRYHEHLVYACNLIYKNFVNRGSAGILSGPQLALKVNRLVKSKHPKKFIKGEVYQKGVSDKSGALDDALAFLRKWANYHFPRYLMALDAIQRHILISRDLEPGDYSAYASSVQNWMLDSSYLTLEEYGLPIQISEKLLPIEQLENFDQVLEHLGQVKIEERLKNPFEYELAQYVLNSIVDV